MDRQGRMVRVLTCIATACAVGGCPNYELAPLEPCTVSGVAIEVPQREVDKVDLLFVVDDSRSMAQEQAALAQELPRMVQILASGDLDGDGDQDFTPVQDMHLGVVSTDLGAAGNAFPEGRCAVPGDDGRLLFPAECSGPREGNHLVFRAGDDPRALGEAFSCGITRIGTDGCGLEQQLDAMLKAVTPPSAPTRFFGGSLGHGGAIEAGTPNAGFVREDAVLAVIVVTDEDDCSIPDESSDLMALNGGIYEDEPINLRCGLHPEALHPLSRYREGLLALKPLNPELVIFAAVTGIPQNLEGQTTEAILADPRMKFEADPDSSDGLPRTSCTFPNPDYDPNDPESDPQQKAYPPRRLVETAGLFGENGVVRSLCQESFAGALDAIIAKISDQLAQPCLPRSLIRNEEGIVECDVVELIPDEAGEGVALCDVSQGRTAEGRRPVTDAQTGQTRAMQVCEIAQVAVKGAALQPTADNAQAIGWYYDDFSPETRESCPDAPQQVRFTQGAEPPPGAVLRLECLRPVSGARESSRGKQAVGMGCEKDVGACSQRSCEPGEVTEASQSCDKPYGLTCEPQTNTCQIACSSDVECPRGWRCQAGPQGGLCVLPTCAPLELGGVGGATTEL